MSSGQPSGARVGKALSAIVGDTIVKARAATTKMDSDARAKFHHDTMEHLERELSGPLASMFAHVLDSPDTPEPMRAYFAEMAGPHHQGTFLLSLAAVIGIGLAGPGAAAAGFTQRLQADSLKQYGNVPLSPAEAATAVIKGWIGQDLGRDQAAYAGVHSETFDVMVDMTGNPPGPQTLIEMLNRGVIDEARFAKGIAEGLTRTEWTDELLALRYRPITAADAIAAEVEGHLTADAVVKILTANGIDASEHDTLYETAGEPPGTQSMLELLNRGVVDQATVEQSIRESRVKNKYIPAIIEMRRHLMPERTVVSAITKGVFTHDQGVLRLLMLGFNAEDAAALAAEAVSTKTAKHKEIAESMVLKAYEDGMATAAEAQTMLEKLSYDPAEATFALQLADHAREDKFRTAGISRVHSLFVSHHIDTPKASTSLDGLGVPPTMRDQLIKLWGLERDANVPRLTVAEWQRLYKLNAITDAEFVQEMEAYGYTPRDAAYLLYLTNPTPKGAAPPGPPAF